MHHAHEGKALDASHCFGPLPETSVARPKTLEIQFAEGFETTQMRLLQPDDESQAETVCVACASLPLSILVCVCMQGLQ